MTSVTQTAKRWEIASIRETEKGTPYIAFSNEVQILVGGRQIDLGEFKTLFLNDGIEQLNYLLDNGHIDNEQYDKRVAKLQEKRIKSVISAPFLG